LNKNKKRVCETGLAAVGDKEEQCGSSRELLLLELAALRADGEEDRHKMYIWLSYKLQLLEVLRKEGHDAELDDDVSYDQLLARVGELAVPNKLACL
jgi:hypothetical protein